MKKPHSKAHGGGKAEGHEGFSPNPDVSHSTGGKKGYMPMPKHHARGAGANKAGGGRDSGNARAL
jgi:hypothetical protein